MMDGMFAGGTTLDFDFRSGAGGRSLDLRSTYAPTSLAEFVRLGASGVDPMQSSPALAMHMAASSAILQAMAPRVLHSAWVKTAVIVEGVILEETAAGAAVADKIVKSYRLAKTAFDLVTTTGTFGDAQHLRKDASGDDKAAKKDEAKAVRAATPATNISKILFCL
mgnify:FL=1